ncbi:FtsX-like permease family protein [Georgenia halophila]|uniref:FtsX-like permease family protein n=1 Tax=Georgenia halophila TaxID=620889 RepID=A0ABP8KSV6_9MICO
MLALPVAAFAVVTALALTVFGGARFFFSVEGDSALFYEGLAILAVTLLLIPLLTLCGAAARLSARRRDRRLSTLSLLGAPAGTVTAMTLLESTLLALTGTVLGVLGHLALAPLVGLVPFRGGPIGASQVLLGPLGTVACVLGLVVLAAASALAGLRRVVVSPLGVRTRQQAPRASLLRALAFVLAMAAGLVMGQLMSVDGGTMGLAVGIVITFGLTMAVLNLVGPLVLGVQAKIQLRRYGGPKAAERLLAARSVLDSPKAAWRQVGGVAMTSFAAVFAGVGLSMVQPTADGGPGGAAAVEEQILLTDIRTGVVLTLVISFVTVAASVAVNQAADVLDRRDLFAALDRMGMPPRRVDVARTRAVMGPLTTVALWSAGSAAILILPMASVSAVADPITALTVAAGLAGGILLVRLALLATRPLLDRVMAGPVPTA